jgi:hypothetical protein
MLLNRIECALMNNPIRAAIQRTFEARRLLRMGGPISGGQALELGWFPGAARRPTSRWSRDAAP